MSCGSGGGCGCSWGKWSLSIVRVVLGIIFFMHGSQKVMGWFGGHGLTATVTMMSGMGMPVALVYAVCFGEFLGGIGLIVGCLSRWAAGGIAIIMFGAVATVHWQNGFFLSMSPDKGNGFEYNLALIAMALAVVIGGPGKCAIDNMCCKKSGCC
ncbi:MAG: hypothetical protein COV45_03930 [Deltaproteobacteria bacterium CG11_big_fil_rev_8_21_14_0_20_47_16]|nr:MAG: hypothetical protein COV45_03930 [Deltaproteobacteria bacterium CG11_big_fil_rev_8_21_14_0_20_47_16]